MPRDQGVTRRRPLGTAMKTQKPETQEALRDLRRRLVVARRKRRKRR